MANKLIIVESPAKAKTIKSYLDDSYEVVASVGHIRDLATTGKDRLGLDVDNNFAPDYRISKGKTKVVSELKKKSKDKEVLLATDPDREGEAIAWHIADELGLDLTKENRVIFTEITKTTVLEALNNPRRVDMNLVKSQEVRRAIDRIIGFKLSNLLQSKIKSKSAGRVQSVALKLIVELEKEIKDFIPEEYFEIKAHFSNFEADYIIKSNYRVKEEEANKIIETSVNPFVVDKIEVKESPRKPKPPFTTSTFQQDANVYLGMSGSRAMSIAQKLYEGVEVNGETTGLITYMRTDSTRMSNQFVYNANQYIEKEFGKEYLGKYFVPKASANQQDAHEAIRPTSVNNTPEKVKDYLDNNEYRIYKRIYERAVSSLMADAIFERTKVTLNANNNLYELSGVKQIFKGFLALDEDKSDKDVILPNFTLKEEINAIKLEKIRKETQPKARYNEASLIKEMESVGIGRPSTYAHTMQTLKAKDRNYTTVEKRRFYATEQGILTSDELTKFFDDIINVNYTKDMEEKLDEISEGKIDDIKLLSDFYKKFIPLIDNAKINMEKVGPRLIGEDCPNCGSPLVERVGPKGPFIGCSTFPKCKYTRNIENGDK